MLKIHSGDSSLLKLMNKSSLLQIIRSEAPISRAALSKQTNLTRATVSSLVEELINDHLVIEIGMGSSNGGRKPMLLEINGEAGFIFAMDLRATDILFIVSNLQGEKLKKSYVPYVSGTDSSITLQQIIEIMDMEMNELPDRPLGLTGIGIGIHGFVEFPTSLILFAPFFGWKNEKWKSRLEDHFQVPVHIENEANLAALGELETGFTPHYSELIYLSIGAGIGAGMIFGGNIFRGIQGYAGEVGHTTIEMDGKLCTCGNRGCWEMYASERSIALRLGLSYTPAVTETIVNLLNKNNHDALQAMNEAGRHLGIGIGNLIHTFNPQMVVIGSQMGKYHRWIHPLIEETINERYSLVQREKIVIRYSTLEDEACALGAIHLCVRKLLNI